MVNICEILCEIIEIKEDLNSEALDLMMDYMETILNPDIEDEVINSKKLEIESKKSTFSELEKKLINKWFTELGNFSLKISGLYDGFVFRTFEELIYSGYVHLNDTKSIITGFDKGLTGRLLVPDYINELAYAVFEYSNLSEVILPDSIEEIPMYAFFYCKQLKKVRLGENVKSIGDNAFAHSRIEDINVSEDAFIGDGAFGFCSYWDMEKRPEQIKKLYDSFWRNKTGAKLFLGEI